MCCWFAESGTFWARRRSRSSGGPPPSFCRGWRRPRCSATVARSRNVVGRWQSRGEHQRRDVAPGARQVSTVSRASRRHSMRIVNHDARVIGARTGSAAFVSRKRRGVADTPRGVLRRGGQVPGGCPELHFVRVVGVPPECVVSLTGASGIPLELLGEPRLQAVRLWSTRRAVRRGSSAPHRLGDAVRV